jgi:polyisoprenoid-binding protein YceI
MVRTLLATALALLLVTLPATAGDAYAVDTAHSEISFRVRHMMSKVSGSFSDFGGTVDLDRDQLERSGVEFRIKAASINTNNERRDIHLRTNDFFDVENHPEIVFKSTRIVPKGDNGFDVHGDLTIRGVTKPIVLPATSLGEMKDPRGRTKVGWEARVTLNRKDYGIVWNQTLDTGGFVLGDEVEVAINLQAVKEEAQATR